MEVLTAPPELVFEALAFHSSRAAGQDEFQKNNAARDAAQREATG